VSIVPPPACPTWIDDRLVVGDSGIDGRGLFATDLVPAGTVVMRLGGRLISSIELEFLLAAADADSGGSYVDTIAVNENAHLVLPPGSRIHFANHSCDPSLWHVGPYEITARRHLHEGDEVTIDYATHSGADGFVMACRCGSKAYRRHVEVRSPVTTGCSPSSSSATGDTGCQRSSSASTVDSQASQIDG
jgi:uncharacterized protein